MQSSFIPANLYNSVYLVVVGFIAYLHYYLFFHYKKQNYFLNLLSYY